MNKHAQLGTAMLLSALAAGGLGLKAGLGHVGNKYIRYAGQELPKTNWKRLLGVGGALAAAPLVLYPALGGGKNINSIGDARREVHAQLGARLPPAAGSLLF